MIATIMMMWSSTNGLVVLPPSPGHECDNHIIASMITA